MPGNDDKLPIDWDPRATRDSRFNVGAPGSWIGAVLLADEIKFYCEQDPPMICPFFPTRLRPASYQLTLGTRVHVGGEERYLSANEPTILRPHQVAVVSTEEVLNIPRFLIARWSLRVGNIYEGLLWTGGPQVDPGWRGQLYCPVYNLSEREVPLYAGMPFFTIDFVRTTALSNDYLMLRQDKRTERTWFTPVRRTLAEHDRYRLHSAPYEALKEVEEVRQFRITAQWLIAVLFTALGATVAAVSIIAARPLVNPGEPPINVWFLVVLAVAVASGILSIGSIWLTWRIHSRLAQFQRRR